MICPRCKKQHDILQYVPLRMIEEFAEETTPIYKCPSCRWVFAPAEQLVAEVVSNGLAERRGRVENMEKASA
jgi:hypothetical protein